MSELANVISGITDRTVRYWTSGRHLPTRQAIEAIDVALFGDNTAHARSRQEMRRAFDHDVAARRRAPSSDRLTHAETFQTWEILEPTCISGLVEMSLHQPKPGNEAGTYYIDATLLVGMAEYDWEDRSLLIGVKEAVLSLTSSGYQVAKGSMIGERQGHVHFRRIPGGVEVIGPRDERGCLRGDPLQEEYVAILESIWREEKPVALALHSGRRSFVIISVDAQGNDVWRNSDSINKDAVLNALIGADNKKDPQGRVLIAQSRMQRKTPA